MFFKFRFGPLLDNPIPGWIRNVSKFVLETWAAIEEFIYVLILVASGIGILWAGFNVLVGSFRIWRETKNLWLVLKNIGMYIALIIIILILAALPAQALQERGTFASVADSIFGIFR